MDMSARFSALLVALFMFVTGPALAQGPRYEVDADWKPQLPADWSVHWDGRAPLALPDGGELRLAGTTDGFDTPVQIRARRGGERIQLPGRTHSH